MKNTGLILLKKLKNSNLYFNEKYKSSFVQMKKIQICVLMKNIDLVLFKRKKFRYVLTMKNTDLVLLKELIQICILMKNTDPVLLKKKFRSVF